MIPAEAVRSIKTGRTWTASTFRAKSSTRYGHTATRPTGRADAWRDRLLGIAAKDYDVATDAPPENLLRYFPDAIRVGAQFGVVLVRRKGVDVQVATFRTDHDYRDGRRPEGVTFTRSAKQDVRRRDFTINGILFDPVAEKYLDFVEGRADLAAKRVRAIGDPRKRFVEDKLRMLRAVRFAARRGFEIEAATFEAIQEQAAAIIQISV